MADDYDPLKEEAVSPLKHPSDYDPLDEERGGRRARPSEGGYPDMTPGPPKTVMGTSYANAPNADNPKGTEWQSQWMAGVPQGAPETRIREAVSNAWQNSSPLTPEYQEKMNNAPYGGWLNRNIINPAISTGAGIVAAPAAGFQATIGELFNAANDPKTNASRISDRLGLPPPSTLGRDLNMLPQAIAPIAAAAAPTRVGALQPRPEMPKPRVAPISLDVETQPSARVREAVAPPGATNTGPSSPTNIPGPIAPPAGYVPPFNPAKSAAEGFTAAGARYAEADAKGGAIASHANDRFVSQLNKDFTPDPQAQRFTGPTATSKTLDDFNGAMQGQNLSLKTFQAIDKDIGDRIGTSLNAGNKSQAADLMEMRNRLRDHVENAGQADTVGGDATGFAALRDARQSWSTAVKMQDVERMRTIAETAGETGGSTTQSFRNQVNSFLRNEKNTRGWSDAEKTALKQSASAGKLDEIYRTFGSRLVPIVAAGAGGLGGYTAAAAGNAVISSLVRDAAANRTRDKIQQALRLISQGMPRDAATPGAPLVPRVAALPQPGYMTGLLGSGAFPPQGIPQDAANANPLPPLWQR